MDHIQWLLLGAIATLVVAAIAAIFTEWLPL
jgi:hypothetical protein